MSNINPQRDAERMFEKTHSVAEILSTHHYEHDEDQFGGVPPCGGITWTDAIAAMADDLRAFEVPERVIELHVARMRMMVGV